jgi:hypothetical protein
MDASGLLAQAFGIARSMYPEIMRSWVTVSHRVGSRLPNSLLPVSIQREGETDVLLRALETEQLDNLRRGQANDLFAAHYLGTLSAYWIGGVYEIFRLLRERGLSDEANDFDVVLKDLELIRMPLEKHEIAKDWRLKTPLELIRQPPDSGPQDIYRYAPKDQQRAHIMPSAISQVTGSMMWHVIDLASDSSFWVERRWLSDKILAMWNGVRAAP